MKVAVVQHDIVFGDAAATIDRLRPRVGEAAAAGARLVVLAEMFAPGFSMDTEAVAETEDGPSAAFLREMAAEHRLWVCGSAPMRPGAGAMPVNRFLLAGPDGTLGHYDKIHPFSYSGEHKHYGAGVAIARFEIEGVRITPFVCYDLRFADLFWEAAPATDCYVVVANWPATRRRHWQALLAARAIENQAYVVAANRVGVGGGLAYAGDSCVVDPAGETLVGASGAETILYADIDAAVVAATRARFPFLADRTAGPRLEVGIDCVDPAALAPFWAEALGYRRGDGTGDPYLDLLPAPGSGAPIVFLQRVPEPKATKNRIHLDLYVTDTDSAVKRLVGLGASCLGPPVDGPGAWFQVMADPAGNEFCVCRS